MNVSQITSSCGQEPTPSFCLDAKRSKTSSPRSLVLGTQLSKPTITCGTRSVALPLAMTPLLKQSSVLLDCRFDELMSPGTSKGTRELQATPAENSVTSFFMGFYLSGKARQDILVVNAERAPEKRWWRGFGVKSTRGLCI